MGYVYIVRAGDAYKIGMTEGPPQRRIATLKTGSAVPLETVHVISVPGAFQLEQALHERFKAQRIRGEWFRLTAADVDAIRREWPDCPEWRALVELEPRLSVLLAEARGYYRQAAEDPEFCANALWYERGGLKARLTELVGWEVRYRLYGHPKLATEQAYDVAYDTIYGAMPDCRHEGLICP